MCRSARRAFLAGILAGYAFGVVAACAKPAPLVPRFVGVFEQVTGACRVMVIRDTRTDACFAMFRCFRQITILAIDAAACVP